MITLTNVTKNFTQGSEIIHALQHTNFHAEAGQFVAVIGPSGSGKSTFLTIAGGLQTPTEGEVTLSGINISQARERQRARVRFEKLGFILQASSLVPFLKTSEQMVLHSKVEGKKADLERRDWLLERLGLTHLAHKYPADLSGGERQRVAIATALMHDPDVILADEPTASLDSERAYDIAQLLHDISHEENKTIVMVTHDQRLLPYCDRVYEIVDGVLSEKTEDFR